MSDPKLYYKKDGTKCYYFDAYLGVDPITGKQIRTRRRGFKTERAARIAEAKLVADYQENGWKNNRKTVTFLDVYKLWLAEYKTTVRESTLRGVLSTIKTQILPNFGHVKLEKIDVLFCHKQLKKWQTHLTSKRYKMYTSMILDYAVTLQLIDKNPMKLLKNPRTIKDDKQEELIYYSKEELQQFLEYAKKEEPSDYPIFRSLAFTGLRKGELAALLWSDIDFDRLELTVSKTVARGLKGQVIHPPKTKKSHRTISIDPDTATTLKRWKMQQKELLFRHGHKAKSDDKQLIFCKLESNQLLPTHFISNRLKAICDKYNFKAIRPHGFRHTHCTLLFESGATVQVVQARLGHSNIQTTMSIYSHVTEKQRDEMADQFAKYIDF